MEQLDMNIDTFVINAIFLLTEILNLNLRQFLFYNALESDWLWN